MRDGVEEVESLVTEALPKGSAQFVIGEATVGLPLGDVIDFAKERATLPLGVIGVKVWIYRGDVFDEKSEK